MGWGSVYFIAWELQGMLGVLNVADCCYGAQEEQLYILSLK